MTEEMMRRGRISKKVRGLLEKDFHVDIKDVYDGADGVYVKMQVREKY